MTAKEQLRALVGELNEEQAERALSVLESGAEWIILGERSSPTPAPRRPDPIEHDSRRPSAGVPATFPVDLSDTVPVDAGRHRGF